MSPGTSSTGCTGRRRPAGKTWAGRLVATATAKTREKRPPVVWGFCIRNQAPRDVETQQKPVQRFLFCSRLPSSPARHRGRVHRVVCDHPERSGLLRGYLAILYQKLGCLLLEIQRKTPATHSPRHTYLPTHLRHDRGRSPARCEAAGNAPEGPDEEQLFCIRNLEFCIRSLVYFTSSRSRIMMSLIYVV